MAGLWCVSASQAAVYTGSATDPAGDLSIYAGDTLPSPPVDFTSVAVRYDDVAGRVEVSYTFSVAPAPSQHLNAGVGLGSIRADGSCSAPVNTSLNWHPDDGTARGEVSVEGDSTNFTGTVAGKIWDNWDVTDSWNGAAVFEWPGSPKRTFNFATTRSSLVGRHYTCAHAGMWIFGGGVGEESLDGPAFFHLTPAVPGPASSAQWLSPKDGQTVTGLLTEVAGGAQHCEARIVGTVVRTENYVDGKLNDTQVFHPWGCVWDTRNYVNGGHLLTVKAYDAANNVIAADTVRVTVNNPNPPPVSNPPPPLIETSPGVVEPSGSTGSQTAKRTSRFTRQKARRAIKRTLARRYGKAFRERKGYIATCVKTSPSSWSCAVRWRHGQLIYKGKVKLTLRSDGRIASRFLLRKTIR